MKKVLFACGLILGCSNVVLAADAGPKGDAAAGEGKVVTCAACHGADGNSAAPSFPKLAGQGEKYLLKQMKDIRDGARPVPTMVGQVDNMSDEEQRFVKVLQSQGAWRGGWCDSMDGWIVLGSSKEAMFATMQCSCDCCCLP